MALAGSELTDPERRFGGLRRLYGDAGYTRLRAARVAVVGVGGVGSWTVEAFARSGVAAITMIDFDQVSESNVNRQVQALGSTIGQAKVDALRARIADIHPACRVHAVEAFVETEHWPALLPEPVDLLIDACDQVRAKALLAAWALASALPFVAVGAAGGKRLAQAVEVEDLAQVTHDPLLAAVRQTLRKRHGAARSGALGVRCVFSREAVRAPGRATACEIDGNADVDTDTSTTTSTDTAATTTTTTTDGSLNCHGYGSSVGVTATFGLVAASDAIEQLLRAACA